MTTKTDLLLEDGVTYATAMSGDANSTGGDVKITSWDINLWAAAY